MLFTYDHVFNFNKSQTMDNSSNWINHLESSPDGNSISFFHRWISAYGRFTRLICYVNQKLEILNGDIMTSHMSWIDNDKVVAFCSSNICENKYHLFSIKNKQNVKILEKLPSTDGHPILLNNKIITDTYPNKAGYSKLIEFDLISNDSELIDDIKNFNDVCEENKLNSLEISKVEKALYCLKQNSKVRNKVEKNT